MSKYVTDLMLYVFYNIQILSLLAGLLKVVSCKLGAIKLNEARATFVFILLKRHRFGQWALLWKVKVVKSPEGLWSGGRGQTSCNPREYS